MSLSFCINNLFFLPAIRAASTIQSSFSVIVALTARSEVPVLRYFVHFVIFRTSLVHVALQLGFPETLSICLQALF